MVAEDSSQLGRKAIEASYGTARHDRARVKTLFSVDVQLPLAQWPE